MPTKRMPVPKPPAARRKIPTGKPRPTAAPAPTTRSESMEHVHLWPMHRDDVTTRFRETVASGDPIFETTATKELFPAYLAAMPHHAQYLNCSACRHFIRRYGGLVAVDELGRTRSAIWPDASPTSRLFYARAEREMARRAVNAKLVRPFISSKHYLGEQHTNGWDHLYVKNDNPFTNALLTAGQMAAKKQEHMRMVLDAINRFPPALIQRAIDILQIGGFNHKEKFYGPLQWLMETRQAYVFNRGYNIIWRRVALAPEGYCHIGGSVIGQLLEDLQARKTTPQIQRRWNAMVNASNYQRPKVAPAAQNVRQAEDIVAKLGIATSLRRRFATMADVQPIWVPSAGPKPRRPSSAAPTFVFADVETRDEHSSTAMLTVVNVAPTRITWSRFRREILTSAVRRIELMTYPSDSYFALTTAVDPDAPPIFKWDHEGNRNPLSWYTYAGPTASEQWGLRPNTFTPLSGIVELPDNYSTNGVVLVLAGCKDSQNDGSGLFPELLRSELFSVRSTIEAYSNSHPLECSGLPNHASGVGITTGGAASSQNCRVRVFTKSGLAANYVIDRWD